MFRYKSKYKKVGVLPIRIVKSNISSVYPSSERNMFLSNEGPTLKTLDFTIHSDSTPTFLYFSIHNTYIIWYLSSLHLKPFSICETPKCQNNIKCWRYKIPVDFYVHCMYAHLFQMDFRRFFMFKMESNLTT